MGQIPPSPNHQPSIYDTDGPLRCRPMVQVLLLDPVDLRRIPWRDGSDRPRWTLLCFCRRRSIRAAGSSTWKSSRQRSQWSQAARYQMVLDRKVGDKQDEGDRPIGGLLRYGLPGIGVTGVGACLPLRDAIFPGPPPGRRDQYRSGDSQPGRGIDGGELPVDERGRRS